jgi:HlyD family secretion protein
MDDRDFSPRLLGTRDDPPAPLPRLMVGLVALLFLGLLAWAVFGRLDIVARAEGRLVPTSRVQVVQPLDGGRIADILVDEGDVVAAGQPLLRMDPRLSRPDLERFQRELELARLQRRRIDATLSGEPFERAPDDDPALFSQVRSEYVSERQAHRGAVETRNAALERAIQELDVARAVRDKLERTLVVDREYEQAYAELGEEQAVARLDILERRRARIEAEADLEAQRERIEAMERRIREARAELGEVTTTRRQRLIRRRNQLAADMFGLRAGWEKQRVRNGLLELRAPRDGTVKDLAVHTEGSVTPSGTVLLSIVPAGEALRAEVMISNQDVGFVHAGQQARVKLSAYPFQRFGTVEGTIQRVSPDARSDREQDPRMQGRYAAVIELAKQRLEYEGERLELRSGMKVLAEIKLGQRSVLEYVLSPVAKMLDYAGKER